MAAQFEIRQKNLAAARRILGNAIGLAPKDKIFTKYIDIELQLGNVDRCRILYQKYIEWAPSNSNAWSSYAELEKSLGEDDRARAICLLAMDQGALDVEELLRGAFPLKKETSFSSQGDDPVEQNKVTKGAKRKRPDLTILEAAYSWKLQKLGQPQVAF
uniref:Crooked neck protein, putative n=1 Tax=Arundo donax TaxID=35708 RepID=A0A0A9C3Z5_ARUDO